MRWKSSLHIQLAASSGFPPSSQTGPHSGWMQEGSGQSSSSWQMWQELKEVLSSGKRRVSKAQGPASWGRKHPGLASPGPSHHLHPPPLPWMDHCCPGSAGTWPLSSGAERFLAASWRCPSCTSARSQTSSSGTSCDGSCSGLQQSLKEASCHDDPQRFWWTGTRCGAGCR